MRVDRRELAAIFAGGVIGALARLGLVEAFPFTPGQWPWATFIANVAGALALGYFTTRLQERLPLSAYRRPFLGTGLCGALTTFSTLQLELLQMLDHGNGGLAAGYAAASIAAGLLAITLTTNLVRRARLAA
ncbi:MAG TPA: fluoride efflux transporter CrcB [Solirubrobacteraceae bacterium]